MKTLEEQENDAMEEMGRPDSRYDHMATEAKARAAEFLAKKEREKVERCCDNSEWPRNHDADCGNRTKPLEGEATPFDTALAAARAALKEMGTGLHRTTLVREGARTYAQRDRGMPLEVAKPPEERVIAPCTEYATWHRTAERLQKEVNDAKLELLKLRHALEARGIKVCHCRSTAEHEHGGCS